MSPNSYRRRRTMSFRMIVYPTSGASATRRGSTISSNPDIGRREPSKGRINDRRGRARREWTRGVVVPVGKKTNLGVGNLPA